MVIRCLRLSTNLSFKALINRLKVRCGRYFLPGVPRQFSGRLFPCRNLSASTASRRTDSKATSMKATSVMTALTGAEGLLPGILDDITFDVIVPKLSWKDILILSSVNRDWLHAIRTHQVYQARVRSRSTDALVLFSYETPDHELAIALYSKIDNSFSVLPGIPNLPDQERIPLLCQCVSVEGKVYVLGGWKEEIDQLIYDEESDSRPTGAVYVLDLAGLGQWKQCASMKQARLQFACGVVDGKIYVFGGLLGEHMVCSSEMYDPKEDTWSSIRPCMYLRGAHRAESVGGELFLHGGGSFGRTPLDSTENHVCTKSENHICFGSSFANFLEVYNPVKDEWRVVEPFWKHRKTVFFSVGGKFHLLSFRNGQLGIDIYDEDKISWTLLYSFSRAVIGPKEFVRCWLLDAVVVDNELSALIETWDKRDSVPTQDGVPTHKLWIIRSRGFGAESKEIEWEKEQVPSGWYTNDFICSIQI